MRALVFQHIACEHPGYFSDLARERGLALEIVAVDEGRMIPDPRSYDALLVFGGPMNVDEDEKYPWLPGERAAIRRAVEGGVPFLGVCLGGQLLARALGVPVTRNSVPEVGFMPVHLEPAAQRDPLFAGLSSPLQVFQWHGDTFALPPGAARLATAPACANQAFRVGSHAYGLQFHVEVTRAQIEEWGRIPEYRSALERLYGLDGPERLLRESERELPGLRAVAGRIFENFCALVESNAASKVR